MYKSLDRKTLSWFNWCRHVEGNYIVGDYDMEIRGFCLHTLLTLMIAHQSCSSFNQSEYMLHLYPDKILFN